MAKKRDGSVLTTSIAGTALTIKVEGIEEALVLDTECLNPAVRERAVTHGLLQRIRDAAAIPRSTETGLAASPREKYEAMKVLVDHYASGRAEWSPSRREGADSLLIRALVAVREKPVERVREYVKGLSPAERRALEQHAEIAAKMAELSGASGVDAEGLLEGL